MSLDSGAFRTSSPGLVGTVHQEGALPVKAGELRRGVRIEYWIQEHPSLYPERVVEKLFDPHFHGVIKHLIHVHSTVHVHINAKIEMKGPLRHLCVI